MSDALTVDSLLGGGRWFWRVVLATGKGTGLREASYNGGVLRWATHKRVFRVPL